ncbi:glucose-6-phosphate dehydrogenase [Aliikangiella coralliicola]|uniref:Glucose-6-phosphate 1-dehydrogenase n=1 Tax=Aliikangiella coralliicola TaxID=2592383 RepID=A0A545UHI1_9GAMM|nr:glucose-6-phosphate dehydrogenase [Aliikangiella coralliicola]TQV88934.1 glucose-6-phosphate dehydrogenase [Aliikangiella coralliicola]
MSEATDLVIFGGTGDLALRKLLPALYRAFVEKNLADNTRIFPSCRSEKQLNDYMATCEGALKKHLNEGEYSEENWASFRQLINPTLLDISDANSGWSDLRNTLSDAQRIFYMAIAPAFFAKCCEQLSHHEIINENSRVVLEKPIGYDRDSAEKINSQVANYFEESQVFRIDHYLGKETVQNLMVLRFSNLLFENMWDRKSIDHIQISISETVGLEGRAGFYDDAGALRDMVQNHLLQLLCLVAMEPPNELGSQSIRTEKVKVLKALQKIDKDNVREHTIRGQYVTGESQQQLVPGYLEELGKAESFCETFVAIRTFVDNWRWSGVPFYLRTGKRLKQRSAEIVVQFKPVSHPIYKNQSSLVEPNKLTIKLQPDEKIQLELASKQLGQTETKLQPAVLDLNLTQDCENFYSDAYKRLLLDVIANDASLFIHRDEIDNAWAWIDPIIQGWAETDYQPELYRSGSWGPHTADQLLQKDGRHWHNPSQGDVND